MPKVQILLRKEYRKPDGVAAVKEIMNRVGIKATGTGFASLSGEISQEAFESMFSPERIASPERMPTGPGGIGGREYQDLPVPEQLKEYVENITVAPPHIYFNGK